MATSAAYHEFRRVLADPASRLSYSNQVRVYDYRWSLYQNSAFDDPQVWLQYRQRYGLYRHIRPIYNPVRRLVDFYAGMVYPGVLSVDAKRLPDGTPLAIPLADDISPALANALGQLWQWSNWQVGKALMERYGAALGSVLVEVVDEVDRGKVTYDIVWPGNVTELELDATGNVKLYTIEYDAEDEEGQYTYKKTVTSESIAEYKNDQLFQYDERIPAERANPYTFAPAVWCKHVDIGGNYGEPAVRNVGKIDELNELASHAHDRAHAVLSSPILFAGDNVASLDPAVTESKRPAGDKSGRESIKILKASANGNVSAVQLPEGEALNYMTNLLEEIENDHPELNMYNRLREMSTVTGPAAASLIGDAASYIQDARANYDTQSVKLFQMAVAIAGWRVNTGAWGRNLTRQQEAFRPFSLESYAAGDLDFEIMPRPLVPTMRLTPDEQRALMEQGDRGYASWDYVTNRLTGNAKEQKRQIEAEGRMPGQPRGNEEDPNADAVAAVQAVIDQNRQ